MDTDIKRIYDGAKHCGCGTAGCDCPVVDYDTKKGTVTLHDPAKPHNGTFTMTAAEYNTLVENAPKIK